ncbi:MAG: LPS export ABC transporter periplasmic protein LptC [Mariniphaga sp.]
MKIRKSFIGVFSEIKLRSAKIVRFIPLLTWSVIFFSCSSKVSSDIPKDLFTNKLIPSVEAFNFQTFYTDSGVVRYFLKTPRLLIFDQEKSPYKEFPEGFHLQQFDIHKKIISELSANYGKNFELEQKWLATGNVVMVNNKGDTLRTEELIYLIKEDRIYSEKFVNIKKGDQDITGSGGFESDSQMKKWAFKNTKGHIYVQEQ